VGREAVLLYCGLRRGMRIEIHPASEGRCEQSERLPKALPCAMFAFSLPGDGMVPATSSWVLWSPVKSTIQALSCRLKRYSPPAIPARSRLIELGSGTGDPEPDPELGSPVTWKLSPRSPTLGPDQSESGGFEPLIALKILPETYSPSKVTPVPVVVVIAPPWPLVPNQ